MRDMTYLQRHVNPRLKTQKQKLNDRQVKNAAGGYSYSVDIWAQLRRFLILGSEGGTYYVRESKLTEKNLEAVDRCLKEDGVRVVNEVVQISHEGRAPKNDQAILVLAKASVHKDLSVRKAAWDALPKVCRIGTHLYMFTEFRKNFKGGWGRLARENVAGWFTQENERFSLAYQAAKYKQRNGWSARDLLRLSHPVPRDGEQEAIFEWICGPAKKERKHSFEHRPLPAFLHACNTVQKTDERQTISLIKEFNLPREVIPTPMLKSKKVWEALLERMPMTAMIRNLGKMSNIGLLTPGSSQARSVARKLGNQEVLQKARVHPVNMLLAMEMYRRGRGLRGSLSWSPVNTVLDAMDEAFYMCFKNVRPTNKPTLIGVDVSRSMSGFWGSEEEGILSPRQIAAAMAMVTLRVEKEWCTVIGFGTQVHDLKISRRDRLDTVMTKMSNWDGGRTDCSVPMKWARTNKVDIDAFFSYTDNETWAGRAHPSQELKNYRDQFGRNAKFVCCAVTASDYSISDPADPHSLDIAGFDAATPSIMSEFVVGSLG